VQSLGRERWFALQTTKLFIASALGGLLGYVYLLLAGRALGAESYGAFGSLFGIFYVFSLVGDALRIAIANQVASLAAREGDSAAIGVVLKSAAKLVLVGLLIVILLMANSAAVASFFHMSSTGPVLVLGGALLTTLLLFVLLGIIQGLQLFGWLALAGYLLPHGLKLAFGALALWMGWKLVGLVGALLASNAIAIGIALLPLSRLATAAMRRSPSAPSVHFGRLAAPALMIGIVICVPTSVDVMLVTHFFDSESAGLYNAAATMGKVVLFLPIAVSLVMLPRVSERHGLGGETRSLLRLGLTCVAAISGAITIAYWILPEGLVRLLFGQEYLLAAPLIGWYGIAMTLFAINYLFAQYDLATSNTRGLMMAIGITLIQVIVIATVHSSLLQIIRVLLLGNLVLAALNLISAARRRAEGVHQSGQHDSD